MDKSTIFNDKYMLPISIVIVGAVIAGAVIYSTGNRPLQANINKTISQNGQATLVDGGKILPFETEKKMLAILVDNGTIDPDKLSRVTELNLLWAFGLANKNPILENGPMMDPKYGGAGNFASTGGWTPAKGNAMDHYSKHELVKLTPEQQLLVEKVAKNIYRPCCDNSTYFPDCNHGMAMLGLLEIMASQGVNEADMYKFALKANTLWFPDTYNNLKIFFASKNIDWQKVDPKEILGAEYSGASGYRKILSQIEPQQQKGGQGCGI